MADGTFYEGLHPVFVTSAKVTDELINLFLESSAEGYIKDAGDFDNAFSWSLQRSTSDAAREVQRVKTEGNPMCGTKPPIGPIGKLDFEGWSLDDLAKWVLEEVGREEIQWDGSDYVVKLDVEAYRHWRWNEPHMDTSFFGILDEQSVEDHSICLVELPMKEHSAWDEESGKDIVIRRTRNWIKRESYDNNSLWEDEEGWENELKAIRISFKKGYIPDDLVMNGGRGMTDLANGANKRGVWIG